MYPCNPNSFPLLGWGCPLYCVDEILHNHVLLLPLYTPCQMSWAWRLGPPLVSGCMQRGAGALIWNSLRETRRKLISLPGVMSLDTVAPTIQLSPISSAFIFLSPHVYCTCILLLLLVSQVSKGEIVLLKLHNKDARSQPSIIFSYGKRNRKENKCTT